jgi:hypothetical protein
MAAIGEHHIDDFWHSTRTIGAAVGPRQGGHHRATTVPSGSQKSQLNHQIGGDRAVVLAGEGGRDEGSAGTGVRPVMRLWKPHGLGRSYLRSTIRHHVTNATDSQNAGALSAGLTAAIGWPANTPAARSAVTPTERTARAGPSNPRSGS